eukprot:1143324-Pelagomonas_calceolata.AAC.5
MPSISKAWQQPVLKESSGYSGTGKALGGDKQGQKIGVHEIRFRTGREMRGMFNRDQINITALASVSVETQPHRCLSRATEQERCLAHEGVTLGFARVLDAHPQLNITGCARTPAISSANPPPPHQLTHPDIHACAPGLHHFPVCQNKSLNDTALTCTHLVARARPSRQWAAAGTRDHIWVRRSRSQGARSRAAEHGGRGSP